MIIVGAAGVDPAAQRKIVVQTRDGIGIDNIQFDALPADCIAQSQLAIAKYVVGKTRRINGPSGFYNCVGLVFASRRTQITDLANIATILQSDGYGEIFEETEADLGDVVVYVHDNDCDHVGLVVAPARPQHGQATPRIFSKLGMSVEVEHDAHEGPYQDCVRRYFRMSNHDIP